MLTNQGIKSYQELTNNVDVAISVNTYFHLRKAVSQALVKYTNRDCSTGKSLDIKEFLDRKGKCARKFKKIFDHQYSNQR